METLRGLLALLCVFLAGTHAQDLQINRFAECPVDLFFVLDTSESVALRQKPPNFYIDQIKRFTSNFIDELRNIRHRCDRILTWNTGALHYSDEVIMIQELSDMATQRQELKNSINTIEYIGKGTYTDCAIKRGLAELLVGGSHYHENKYIVVVTDGHPITGYKEPCGGVQEAANEAKQHGVKVFAVAISPDQEDTRLSLIATDQNYRQNFTAADESRSTKIGTIHSIIDMITNETKDTVCVFRYVHIILCFNKYGERGRPGMPGEKGDVGNMVGDSAVLFFQHRCQVSGLMGERGHKGYKGDKGQRGRDGVDGRKGEAGFPGLAGCKGSPGGDVRFPFILFLIHLFKHCSNIRNPVAVSGRSVSRITVGRPLIGIWITLRGRGIKGSAGDRGPMGPTGEVGIPGNGTAGCPGFQGYPGPRGDPGEPVSISATMNVIFTRRIHPLSYRRVLFTFRVPKELPDLKEMMEILGILLWDIVYVFTECKCATLDLAFVVDSSESIGATNFALAKDFIITVIDRLAKDQQVKFAGNDSRVSVVQYSGSQAQEIVQLGVRTNDLRWLAEATYTGEALDFALKNTIRLMRQENRVVLVLTDGRSDIIRDRVPLNVLCGNNVRVGGLGINDYSGRPPNPEQLDALVCKNDPKPGFSFVLDNFAELLDDTFLQNLTSQICQDKKCPDYKCPISFANSADILVMMDSSASVGQKNFEMSKTFVRRLAERFLTADRQGSALVRVGVGQYSRAARMEVVPTSNLTLVAYHTDQAVFQNDGTNVLEAMEFAINNLRSRGDASGGKKKLVLFSDGRSQAVTEAVLEKRVREVADAGVELFVITAGNQVNEANLRTLVSRGRQDDISFAQRHLFRVPDYPSLLRGVFHQTVSRRVSL
uniref:Collagen type VI alpha 1 chain n=1 Tax=Takifugu rubripes TaxID=31033 RepID=A0A674N1F4_TAKRU